MFPDRSPAHGRNIVKTKLYALLALFAVLLVAACSREDSASRSADASDAASASAAAAGAAETPDATPGFFHGKVVETMDASGYTYICVDTGQEKVWAAAPHFDVAVGEVASFPATMPMPDFKSETLDRSFDVVYFVNQVNLGAQAPAGASGQASSGAQGGDSPGAKAAGTPVASDIDLDDIELPDGGLRIAAIYAGKDDLVGAEVLVRGKVVKYNGGIMGRNWLHIQDGSGEAPANDITVTTSDEAEVGQTVLVRGTLATDRDFGSGYRYAAIIEKASLRVE